MRRIVPLLILLVLLSTIAFGQKAQAGAHRGAHAAARPALRPAPLNKEAAAALAQAAEAAAAMDKADSRASMLVRIGVAQCKAGDLAGLRKLVPAAISALDAFTPKEDFEKSSKASDMGWVGYLHACLGDVAKGIEEVEAQGNEQAGALGNIAGLQAQGGDYEGALATAKRISVSYKFNDAMKAILRAQIAARRFDAALGNVELLRSTSAQMDMLAAIRKEQIKQHLGADSLAVLDKMRAVAAGESDAKQKVFLLARIGNSLGENGDSGGCMTQLSNALKAAEALPASLDRVSALTNVADGMSKNCDNFITKGEASKALGEGAETASSLPRGDQKTAYYWLARSYAQSGDTATALQMVDKHPVDDYIDENSKTDLRQQIAMAEAKAGDFTSALQLVRAMTHIWYRADGLVGIAEAYGTGNKAQAMALLTEAQGVYHQGDKDPMAELLRLMAFRKLVDDYVLLGEPGAALRSAVSSGNYDEFGKALAKNGAREELQPAVGQTKDPGDKADIFLGFAEGWMEAHLATPAAPAPRPNSPAARPHK